MKLYLVELEPVETRYTAQWKTYLPEQLRSYGLNVEIIAGPGDAPQDTTPGAFLNFSGTNYWKSEQLKTISQLFAEGKVKDGDYFLYTDAWNPTVIQLKYMAELLGVKIKIGGMWHAGSYDSQDFLGRLIGNAPWVRHAEKSMFHIYDHNFFATNFHIEMFMRELLNDGMDLENPWFEEDLEEVLNGDNPKFQRVGWPMEYMPSLLSEYKNNDTKENIVLFPHRIAPEKQVEIFKDLGKEFPDFDFVVCQEEQLTKDEYHNLLSRAKAVFSANTQETLGISCYEGALLGAQPIVPDRLSYTEMYDNDFKYPSKWTKNWDSYKENKDKLVEHIRLVLTPNEARDMRVVQLANDLSNDFFNGKKIYETIRGNLNEHH